MRRYDEPHIYQKHEDMGILNVLAQQQNIKCKVLTCSKGNVSVSQRHYRGPTFYETRGAHSKTKPSV